MREIQSKDKIQGSSSDVGQVRTESEIGRRKQEEEQKLHAH